MRPITVLSLALAALCLAGCSGPTTPNAQPAEAKAQQPPTVEPSQSRTFVLQRPDQGGPVFLVVAGRIEHEYEYDLRHAIGLHVNGVLLTPLKLTAPLSPYTSNPVGLYRTWPVHLYDADKQRWAFKRDTDWIANNAGNKGKATQPGYCLVFDVTDLLHAGDNHVTITNHNRPNRRQPSLGHFVIRHVGLTTTWRPLFDRFNRLVAPWQTTLVPQWTWFHYHHPSVVPWYLDHFKDDPVRLAELKLQLALLALYRDKVDRYVDLLEQSLAAAPDFPNREMVRYGLAVEGRPVPPAGKLTGWPRDITGTVFSYGSPRLWNRRLETLRYARTGRGYNEHLLPVMRVGRTERSITIDGDGTDAGWNDGLKSPVDKPLMNKSIPPTEPAAEVTAVAGPDALYLRFTGHLGPNPAGPRSPGDGSPVWDTNAIEVFISPELRPGTYWEMNVDVFGVGWIHNVARYPRHRLMHLEKTEQVPVEWQHAARTTDGAFVVEYRIPYKTLNTTRPAPGDVWTASLVFLQWDVVNGRRVGRVSFFSPMPYYDYHVWPAFGFVVFK